MLDTKEETHNICICMYICMEEIML